MALSSAILTTLIALKAVTMWLLVHTSRRTVMARRLVVYVTWHLLLAETCSVTEL